MIGKVFSSATWVLWDFITFRKILILLANILLLWMFLYVLVRLIEIFCLYYLFKGCYVRVGWLFFHYWSLFFWSSCCLCGSFELQYYFFKSILNMIFFLYCHLYSWINDTERLMASLVRYFYNSNSFSYQSLNIHYWS